MLYLDFEIILLLKPEPRLEAMCPATKPLHQLEKGKYIRFSGTEWCVKRKDLYSVSPRYKETQWTLVDQHGAACYLVRAMEHQKGSWEEYWIWTRQIPLSKVEYDRNGWWEPIKKVVQPAGEFKSGLSPGSRDRATVAAPQRVRYKGLEYTLHDQHEANARDDHGAMVPKITWDYLDQGRQRNLAIEIWREPDKDYPEAYDGVTIDPQAVQQIEAAPLRRFTPQYGMLAAGAILAFFGLFAFLGGLPFDMYLAGVVPFLAVSVLMTLYVPFAWLLAMAVAGVCLGGMISLGASSFWTICLASILAAVFIPPMLLRTMGRTMRERPTFVAWGGVLPAVWIYSFYMFFHYAPGPHEGYHLSVTCLIPLVLTGICFIFTSLVGGLWLSRD
jgi:hypothetical protein